MSMVVPLHCSTLPWYRSTALLQCCCVDLHAAPALSLLRCITEVYPLCGGSMSVCRAGLRALRAAAAPALSALSSALSCHPRCRPPLLTMPRAWLALQAAGTHGCQEGRRGV